MGPRSHRPAFAAAEPDVFVQLHRSGSPCVHHRHRSAQRPPRIRWSRGRRSHASERRTRYRRLQRPRHSRCRHRRRPDLRSRQGRQHRADPRAVVHRSRQHVRRRLRRQLDGRRPRRWRAGRGEHEPRRPRQHVDEPSSCQRGTRRHHDGGGGRQQQPQRERLLPGVGAVGDHRRFHHVERRPLVVLQLGIVARHFRAGLVDHLGLPPFFIGRSFALRYFDGQSACRGSRSTAPRRESEPDSGAGRRRLALVRDTRRGHQPGLGFAQPASLHARAMDTAGTRGAERAAGTDSRRRRRAGLAHVDCTDTERKRRHHRLHDRVLVQQRLDVVDVQRRSIDSDVGNRHRPHQRRDVFVPRQRGELSGQQPRQRRRACSRRRAECPDRSQRHGGCGASVVALDCAGPERWLGDHRLPRRVFLRHE